MLPEDPLVSAGWLKDHIDRADVKLLDATWVPPFLTDRKPGRASYDEAHIPGAVYFDIDQIADQSAGQSHMLPSGEQFGAQVGALGISNSDTVIAYDSNDLFASARVWWMFRAMGHDQVRVLDGGLAGWEVAGGPVTHDVPNPIQAGFTANARPDLVRDMTAMRGHIQNADTKILDARAQGRFDGTSPEPRKDLPSGHMPGSFCVPSTLLMAPDGTMKSATELREFLGDHTSGPVVTSCGSGVSAAVISLALARIGNWDAALYDGSWSEWAAHSDNPIETVS